MIYLCLIAMAVSCVCAGWQLRGNYDDNARRFPIDEVPRAALPVARIHRDPFDVPACQRRQRIAHHAVFGKRQRMPVIDAASVEVGPHA